jgi:hypothetical protein
MHPFLNNHVYCKDFQSCVSIVSYYFLRQGFQTIRAIGNVLQGFFFILYITFSSFFSCESLKRRGGMGYVCTVRQLGLLYFPLYPAFYLS